MKLRFTRYTPDMLHSLSRQSFTSIILNALVRGFLFALLLQLIAFASGLRTSSVLQVLLLALIFSFIVFSIDVTEKGWAQYRLRKRA